MYQAIKKGTQDRALTDGEVLATQVLDFLNDRGGFDHWWGGIDPEVQDEIFEQLVSVVTAY